MTTRLKLNRVPERHFRLFGRGFSQLGLQVKIPPELDFNRLALCMWLQLSSSSSVPVQKVEFFLRGSEVDEHHLIAGLEHNVRYRFHGYDFFSFWQFLTEMQEISVLMGLGYSFSEHQIPEFRMTPAFKSLSISQGWRELFGAGIGDLPVQSAWGIHSFQLEKKSVGLLQKQRSKSKSGEPKFGAGGVVIGPLASSSSEPEAFGIRVTQIIKSQFNVFATWVGVQSVVYQFLEANDVCCSEICEIWLSTPNSKFCSLVAPQFDQNSFPSLGSFIDLWPLLGANPIAASIRFLQSGLRNRLLIHIGSDSSLSLIHLRTSGKNCDE